MSIIWVGKSERGFEVHTSTRGLAVMLHSLPRWALDRMAALDMCDTYDYVPGLGSRGTLYDPDSSGPRGIRVLRVGALYRLDVTESEVEEIKQYIEERKCEYFLRRSDRLS
jgi:hypothetical protein